jgi:hypothetical protein
MGRTISAKDDPAIFVGHNGWSPSANGGVFSDGSTQFVMEKSFEACRGDVITVEFNHASNAGGVADQAIKKMV